MSNMTLKEADHALSLNDLGQLEIGEGKDDRPSVWRIWQILTDPNRSSSSVSIDYRVMLIRRLERLFKTEFVSTGSLRQHVERYLDGYDRRRLPIGKALKKSRKKARLSQLALAELLGLKDHTLISKYESGKRMPPLKVIEWLREMENVTEKRRGKGNSRTPSKPVTSSRGKEAPIIPNLAKSVTSPKQPECLPDVSPATLMASPAQLGLFPPADPQASPIAEGPSTEEAPNV